MASLFELSGGRFRALFWLMLLFVLEGIIGRRVGFSLSVGHDFLEIFFHFDDEVERFLLGRQGVAVLRGENFFGGVVHERFGLA